MYAGVQTRGTRPDAIPEGCILEVTLTAYYDDPPLNERGQIMGPPWGKIHFSIDAIEKAGPDLTQRVGDVGVVLISLDPKTRGLGPARVKEAVLAFAGFDGTFGEGYTEADFDALDPNMTIIDAAAGRETLASRAGITLIGRRARLVSKRGKPRKPTKDGEIATGYYVEYAWSALDELPLEIPAPLTEENWADA